MQEPYRHIEIALHLRAIKGYHHIDFHLAPYSHSFPPNISMEWVGLGYILECHIDIAFNERAVKGYHHIGFQLASY